MNRVTVYIDGLNFEYGLKRMVAKNKDWNQFFWIDFVKLFDHFAVSITPHLILKKVVYFTSKPLNVQKIIRQSSLIKANRLLNGNRFEVIYGQYHEKELLCPSCNFKYKIPEEKRTDVNISVQMVRDCTMNNTDFLFLVSADSDLIPPLKTIRKDYLGKTAMVFFPPSNFSYDINNFMKSNKGNVIMLERNKGKFMASVMPDVVTVGGKSSTIPPEWKV